MQEIYLTCVELLLEYGCVQVWIIAER